VRSALNAKTHNQKGARSESSSHCETVVRSAPLPRVRGDRICAGLTC